MTETRQLILFGEEFPLSVDNTRVLLLQAIMVGNVIITSHFSARAKERGFTTIDVERLLRDGAFRGDPEHCEEFNNWVFRVLGKCDTKRFEARVALDWSEDLEYPTVVYITAFFKGR
jgi:hypothetical protein